MPKAIHATKRAPRKKQAAALVPALTRGAAILDFIAESKQPVTAQQIADALDLPKSSAHNLCATLLELNLIFRKADQTYTIGPHVMRWANVFQQRSDVAAEFANIWDESTGLPGATIALSVRDGAEIVYVATRNSGRTPGMNFRIGMRLPAAFTATGKALLSHLPDARIAELFENGFPKPLTRYSVQTLERLMTDVRKYRKDGYSIDNQETSEGMICFGSAVLDSGNHPIAAIAVSIPASDPILKNRDTVIAGVKDFAGRISRRLGATLEEPQ
ncbi:IclR family transcriptional regulator [Aestuariivirga sp.]|uniref:IclR family transcriptional regulator n=1 Tax=Aestuariivirga sp. TaxID=2650926 RepID=UPI0039E56D56